MPLGQGTQRWLATEIKARLALVPDRDRGRPVPPSCAARRRWLLTNAT